MRQSGTIELHAHERALLDEIDFDATEREDIARSCAAARRLASHLLDRGAVSKQRQRYFVEPEWGAGRMSWMQMLEDDGVGGADILMHPGFLRFLRFFIHGTDLPEAVIAAMCEQVGDSRTFKSEDVVPACKLARQLARSHGLGSSHADAFLRLGAELGLAARHAFEIHRAVAALRP
jgi:hypothetical protein